jgi:hypothetical protein
VISFAEERNELKNELVSFLDLVERYKASKGKTIEWENIKVTIYAI